MPRKSKNATSVHLPRTCCSRQIGPNVDRLTEVGRVEGLDVERPSQVHLAGLDVARGRGIGDDDGAGGVVLAADAAVAEGGEADAVDGAGVLVGDRRGGRVGARVLQGVHARWGQRFGTA